MTYFQLSSCQDVRGRKVTNSQSSVKFSTSFLNLKLDNERRTSTLNGSDFTRPNGKDQEEDRRLFEKAYTLKFRHKIFILIGLTGLSSWFVGKFYLENSDIEKTVSFELNFFACLEPQKI